MILLFIVNVIVVTLVTSEFCQKTTEENPSEKTEEKEKKDKAKAENQGEKPERELVKRSKPFYKLKAALTAMWLPAVVGDKKNLFIAASLSTLITKIVMLLLSVILVFFFQESIHPHPFILWSRVDKIFNCLLKDRSMKHLNML